MVITVAMAAAMVTVMAEEREHTIPLQPALRARDELAILVLLRELQTVNRPRDEACEIVNHLWKYVSSEKKATTS